MYTASSFSGSPQISACAHAQGVVIVVIVGTKMAQSGDLGEVTEHINKTAGLAWIWQNWPQEFGFVCWSHLSTTPTTDHMAVHK